MEHSATTNENSSVQTVNYQLVEQRPNPVAAANFDAFNYVSLAPFMPIYGQNYVFQNQILNKIQPNIIISKKSYFAHGK